MNLDLLSTRYQELKHATDALEVLGEQLPPHLAYEYKLIKGLFLENGTPRYDEFQEYQDMRTAVKSILTYIDKTSNNFYPPVKN
jgi:hypothetical protein